MVEVHYLSDVSSSKLAKRHLTARISYGKLSITQYFTDNLSWIGHIGRYITHGYVSGISHCCTNAPPASCKVIADDSAWQATSETKYLERSAVLAQRFTIELAAQSDGMVWEHYDINWQVDMQFNIDKPNDRYKPWGFQPGHQVEWSKLLLILHEAQPDGPWLTRARELFNHGIKTGWHTEFGGLVYSVAPDGSFCPPAKYFWVQAEAISTAWRLYKVTNEEQYLQEYNRLWQWAWHHLLDHGHGAWFRVCNHDGTAIDNKKSPLSKTDYYTMGACWDVLESF